MSSLKKIVSIILFILMSSSFIVGCSNTKQIEQEDKQSKKVKVSVPDGLPAVSISKIIAEKTNIKDGYDVEYSIEKTPDALSTTVMKQDVDIAIVPSNMAAIAYNKTGNYKIGGTTGLGSFYLVSTEDINEMSQLKGEEVANIGKGLTPDIITKFVLKENGINSEDINFTYVSSASELVTMVSSKKVDNAIVPEPALSALMSINPDFKIIKNLNQEYKDITGSEFGYPQATIIIKSNFVKNNKEFVNRFLDEVSESIDFVNSNPEKAGEFAQKIGVTTKKDMISKSIEKANLKFIKSEDAIKEYEDYYKVLSEYDIKTLGGKLPDEKIYIEK
ncbi:MAG: ABC transporter substrate-binding protein [Terrisporobacter sp.]